jgi:hypothetical protein
MIDEQVRQEWGTQEQPRRPARNRWSGRKTIAAVAIALAVLGGGGAAVYAAALAKDSSTSAQWAPAQGGAEVGGDVGEDLGVVVVPEGEG